MERTKVSIVVPVFNREELLPKTVQSVLNQNYQDWELILVDDGSSDSSFLMAQKFANQDSRIISIQRTRNPKGAPSCRNIGLAVASGTYLMFLDSDDELQPNCLKNRSIFMSKNINLNFSVWQVASDFGNGDIRLWANLSYEDDILAFLSQKGWQTSSTFFRRAFISGVLWKEELSLWQDWDYHLRILLKQGIVYEKVINSDPDVLIRRTHIDRISTGVFKPDSIKELSILFDGFERLLKEVRHKKALLKLWFKYIEYASLRFDKRDFKFLIEIWKKSPLQKLGYAQLMTLYLMLQQNLRLKNSHTLQAIPYRIMKQIMNKN